MPKPITGTISGSRSAAVLGLSKYTSPFAVWQSIMEDRDPGFNKRRGYDYEIFEGNAATRFGTAFEESCISITELKINNKITDQEKVFSGKIGKVDLSCHVDGIIGNALYEGKTVFERGFRLNWGDPETENIPRKYQIQCHHNNYLSDTDESIISCLVFPRSPADWESEGWEIKQDGFGKYVLYNNNTYACTGPQYWAHYLDQMGYHHLYKIKRNDELIKSMIEKYQEFWERFVLPAVPPEPINIDDIKRMVPNPCGTVVIDNDFLIKTIKEYKEINSEMSKTGTLGKRKEQLKTIFLDRIRELPAVKDDESTDKWIFRDSQGNKLGSWGKDKRGYFVLR